MSDDFRPKPKRRAKSEWSPKTRAKWNQQAAEKTIKRLKKDKLNLDLRVERQEKKKEVLQKIIDPSTPKLIDGEEIDLAGASLNDDTCEIIFKPNPGPQTAFFEAPEREVFYGGAAGGGKSMALIIDAARDAWHPAHRAIIFRRYIDELRDLIAKTKEVYPQLYPGVKWNKQESTWSFPSGASVWYTYLENEDDVTRYQGQAFNYIGFDELTQWPTPYCWNYLRSRLRTTASDLRLYMRGTGNPGGIGGHWVKKMFIDPAPWGESFWATDTETGRVLSWPDKDMYGNPHPKAGLPLFKRKFIPAKLSDNPFLYKDGEYEKNLLSLPEAQRKRLLDGDWDAIEGAAFPEFNRNLHVVDPFKIPSSWVRFRACDYGYGSPSCVLWMVMDGEGRIFIYRELYGKGYTVPELSEAIVDIEAQAGERMRYGVLDSSMWDNRGNTGPTPAEQMNGPPYRLGWRKADRSPNSRKAGKLELHRRLRPTPSTMIKMENGLDYEMPGRPMLQIFSSCVNLIRTLPTLPLDKHDPDDVDTEAEDHAYDAARYGAMSRPMRPDFGFSGMYPARVIPVQPHGAADPMFGY